VEPIQPGDDPLDNPCLRSGKKWPTRRNESDADRASRYLEAFSNSDRPDRATGSIPERLPIDYIQYLHARHQHELGLGPEENIRFADPESNVPVQRWLSLADHGDGINADYVCFDGETIESWYLPRRVFKNLTPKQLDENPAYVKVNEYMQPVDGSRRISPRIQGDPTDAFVADCNWPEDPEDCDG
jgi:hypothetical protein